MKFLVSSIFLLICSTVQANAQTIQTLSYGTNTSLRGLSVVDDKTIWVSGSNGTIGRSIDSGHTWKWMVVHGFEHAEFRDIEAFDETAAVIMGAGSPAYILRTNDGGSTWKVTFEEKDSAMYLDAMYFWNEQSGIVVGDPISKRFYIARTFDGGLHWRGIPEGNYPGADSGEICFAASGTNICKLNNDEACFVSGGLKSRLFIQNQQIDIPFAKGSATIGANSIATKNSKQFIIVGGDYQQVDSSHDNCFITKDGGKTWIIPAIPPNGYRSCVEYIGKTKWICCGINGVDYSNDDGNTWSAINTNSFNVCQKAKNKGKSVFLAGNNGIIARFIP
jgi:photosystem II stability/assembly factor-like uncharacterized protein